MTDGSGVRGCAATASVTMTPSTGGMIGRMVFCAGIEHPDAVQRRRGLRVRVARAGRRVQGTMRVGSTASSRRHCDQLTRMRFVPSHSGKPEWKRPPGEGPGTVRTSIQRGRRLRGAGHAGIREQRLRVLDEAVGVDDREVAAEIDVGALAREHHETSVAHLARAHELDGGRLAGGRIDGAGQMRERAVVQLHVRAVGVRGVQVQPVAARGAVPAREQHAAVLQHLRRTGRCSG